MTLLIKTQDSNDDDTIVWSAWTCRELHDEVLQAQAQHVCTVDTCKLFYCHSNSISFSASEIAFLVPTSTCHALEGRRSMGNKAPKLPKEDVAFLMSKTNFSDKQIKQWYRGFMVSQWRSVVEIYVYSTLCRMCMCTQIKNIRSLYMENTAVKQFLPRWCVLKCVFAYGTLRCEWIQYGYVDGAQPM